MEQPKRKRLYNSYYTNNYHHNNSYINNNNNNSHFYNNCNNNNNNNNNNNSFNNDQYFNYENHYSPQKNNDGYNFNYNNNNHNFNDSHRSLNNYNQDSYNNNNNNNNNNYYNKYNNNNSNDMYSSDYDNQYSDDDYHYLNSNSNNNFSHNNNYIDNFNNNSNIYDNSSKYSYKNNNSNNSSYSYRNNNYSYNSNNDSRYNNYSTSKQHINNNSHNNTNNNSYNNNWSKYKSKSFYDKYSNNNQRFDSDINNNSDYNYDNSNNNNQFYNNSDLDYNYNSNNNFNNNNSNKSSYREDEDENINGFDSYENKNFYTNKRFNKGYDSSRYNNNNSSFVNNNIFNNNRKSNSSNNNNYSHNNHHNNISNNNNNNNSTTNNQNDKLQVEEKRKPVWDDENDYYKVQVGEYLTDRYKVLSIVGSGTFSTVVECFDYKTGIEVAIKIVRSVRKYTDDALIEIEILNSLEKGGVTNDKYHCIKLLDWFKYRDHMCLVFKKYGLSLYDFLKKNKYRPLPLSQIQKIGRQLLTAIHSMHKLSLVHTDLKPENILLEKTNYGFHQEKKVPIQLQMEALQLDFNQYYHLNQTDIVVIDFGGATFENKHHTTVVCSRPYRPPEIVLGLGWSYPCDIWGVGCILVELYLGFTLFDTHNNRQHLAMMEKVMGPFPVSMSNVSKKYFESDGKLSKPENEEESKSLERVESLKNLKDYFHPSLYHNSFFDLTCKLLEYVPSKRISAKDALSHPFFSFNIQNDLFDPII